MDFLKFVIFSVSFLDILVPGMKTIKAGKNVIAPAFEKNKRFAFVDLSYLYKPITIYDKENKDNNKKKTKRKEKPEITREKRFSFGFNKTIK